MPRISFYGYGIIFKFYKIDEETAEKLLDARGSGISEEIFLSNILYNAEEIHLAGNQEAVRGLIVDHEFSLYFDETVKKIFRKNEIKKFQKSKLEILPNDFVIVSCNSGKGEWFVFESEDIDNIKFEYTIENLTIGEDADYEIISIKHAAGQSGVGELDFDDEKFFLLWSDNEIFNINF